MQNQSYIPALKFHWLTNIYDSLISTFMPEKEFKNAIIINANIQDNFKVLDFGIGTATLSLMAYQSNSYARYIGIDIDDNILKLAHNKISNSQAKIELVQYQGGKIPFDDDSFDRIISSLVFHHLTDNQKLVAFQEFYRVLKPNGEVHIADWGRANNKIMKGLFHIVQLLDGYDTTTANVDGKLPEIIKSAGFHNVDIKKHFNTILGTLEIFKITK
jgi:ubiquinone/menaquinone biosynthesis C-methylase UbiE